jgi:hypothetical protein
MNYDEGYKVAALFVIYKIFIATLFFDFAVEAGKSSLNA